MAQINDPRTRFAYGRGDGTAADIHDGLANQRTLDAVIESFEGQKWVSLPPRKSMVELAAFLGNPGGEYQRTRHNAGWLLAEQLPFFPALDWRKKFQGRYASLEDASLFPGRVHFLMPETYMNNSGDSIHAAASFFKIPPERILLVHDELELPLGTVSLKFSGGLGGHNGLRSMRARFNTADFWRLRLGIGRPDDRKPGQGGHEGSGQGILGWVLSAFSPEEAAILSPVFAAAAAALTEALGRGPETLLPEWGKKKIFPAAPESV